MIPNEYSLTVSCPQYYTYDFFGTHSTQNVIVEEEEITEAKETMRSAVGKYVWEVNIVCRAGVYWHFGDVEEYIPNYTCIGEVSWNGHTVELPADRSSFYCISPTPVVTLIGSGDVVTGEHGERKLTTWELNKSVDLTSGNPPPNDFPIDVVVDPHI